MGPLDKDIVISGGAVAGPLQVRATSDKAVIQFCVLHGRMVNTDTILHADSISFDIVVIFYPDAFACTPLHIDVHCTLDLNRNTQKKNILVYRGLLS